MLELDFFEEFVCCLKLVISPQLCNGKKKLLSKLRFERSKGIITFNITALELTSRQLHVQS